MVGYGWVEDELGRRNALNFHLIASVTVTSLWEGYHRLTTLKTLSDDSKSSATNTDAYISKRKGSEIFQVTPQSATILSVSSMF